MLKFPPLKKHPITEYNVYRAPSRIKRYTYTMFDKTGNIVGKMLAFPTTIRDINRQYSPNADEYPSFFIDRLFAYQRKKGVGKAFINIAQKESIRNLCLGNLHVIASSYFDKTNPPYIFYRKLGFNCNKYTQETQKYLDNCIKRHRQVAPQKVVKDLPMYIEKDVDLTGESVNKAYQIKIKFPEIFEFM